jgi:hypothetical protein
MHRTTKLTQEEFLQRCKENFGTEYTYEKTVYRNTRSKVIVTCREHGDFEKGAKALLDGVGCPKCDKKRRAYNERRRMTTEEFVAKATKKHDGFYLYDKSKYYNSRTKLTITCPIHGDFQQQAGGHLEGYGCQKCADLKHGDYRPWYIKTYFDRFPEKKNQPATLYLLYCAEEDFYKVGITVKENVEERVKYMAHYNFEVIDTVTDSMYNVSIAEQDILKEFEKYKPSKRFGGYSECITEKVDIHQYVPKGDGIPIKEEIADL